MPKKWSFETNREFCKKLNNIATDVAMAFVHKYFWDNDRNDFSGELHRIEHEENELHQNLFINDYYFSLETIYSALYFNVSKEDLFSWYDHVQRSYMEWSTHHSLRNRYLLHHQILTK